MVPITVPSTSTVHEPPSQTPTQQLLTSLRSPFVTLEELEDVLLQTLAALNAVPHTFKPSSRVRTELHSDGVLHIMSTVQHIILNAILPAWLVPLREAGHEQLAKAFFCPLRPSDARTAHTETTTRGSHDIEVCCRIVTSALPSLLSHLPTLNLNDPGPAVILAFAVSTLGDLISSYPVDVVYDALFASDMNVSPRMDSRRTQEWEDYVQTACSVPGRVANAVQRERNDGIACNEMLEYGAYFSNVCVSTEKILFRITQKGPSDTLLQAHAHLLLKLLTLGMFPPHPPTLPSQPSFFSSTLPAVQRRLHHASIATTTDAASSQYSAAWTAVIKSLPLTSQQTFLASLLGALDCQVGRDTSASARGRVSMCARVLRGVVGRLGESESGTEDEELWSAVSAVVCGAGRTWDVGIVRAVVCWVANPSGSSVDESGLKKLLNITVALWTNPEHIRHSLLSQHRYTSSLLLLTLAALPASSRAPNLLALSPPFISSISTYIGHLDVEVRRCGMLVAEVVAKRCGQKLAFGGWEGVSEGLEWARAMRGWEADWMGEGFQTGADMDSTGTADKENGGGNEDDNNPSPSPLNSPPAQTTPAPDSDDDSLQGYDSPPSSRSPSPTPSELAEIEKDPTLRVGRPKPVARPVYLAQLVALLRAGSNTNEEGAVEKIEVVLAHAEGLVRRKKGFGMELEENAVEVTIMLVGLKDNFELEGFDERRQGALNALVECCPRKAAMTLVEQFFTNQYSIAQRFTILTALAVGARALAGLHVPASSKGTGVGEKEKDVNRAWGFPSKMLPPALHRRYATEEERVCVEGRSAVQQMVRGITGSAMQRSKEEVEDVIPEVVRERRLRLGSTRSRITEVVDTHVHAIPSRNTTTQTQTTFAEVAAEHFIIPLVNHMWLHLRDVETRTRGRPGTGTGVILGSVVLGQYLGTLAVLVHAARHAPAFLGVVVPGAVEIAVALGRRGGDDALGERENAREGPGAVMGEVVAREAAVLTAALEVALVALDASVDLDGGRTLGLEHTALLLGVGEWAGVVLAAVEGGRQVRGGGGTAEGRAGAAAAGVVVKVEKVVERWGRSMVGL